MDFKELFNAIKNSQIKFSGAMNKQNKFLNKLNNIKIGKKTTKQKGVINNITRFYLSREEVINFFRDYVEMLSDAHYNAKQTKTKGKGLKNINNQANASKITNSLCTSKSR